MSEPPLNDELIAELAQLPEELRKRLIALTLELPQAVWQDFARSLLEHWPTATCPASWSELLESGESPPKSELTREVLQDAVNLLDSKSRPSFRKQLEGLLNTHSMENGSNTPDCILAFFLCRCLEAFDAAVARREGWHNRSGGDR
jgi:hypothetical protein